MVTKVFKELTPRPFTHAVKQKSITFFYSPKLGQVQTSVLYYIIKISTLLDHRLEASKASICVSVGWLITLIDILEVGSINKITFMDYNF